ncbi:type II secretion system F family protein [Desulfuromonas carbonis]|uniref:type II secretion system F family protein n=1 Tax=Desulfuromonas sp. DDH964 TaxID=1823759 RepID=UPI00078B96D6|nr:type II secretion system F family protein [Desulfuromonas sp. DDH964]AMV72781.1 type II secretion system inner membrane protein PulF [Desulfuromonas sp. DDH964]
MPTYLCKLGTVDGRVLEKEFEASNQELLRENLETQGFFVFRIRKRLFRSLIPAQLFRRRLNSRRFLALNQELLVLLRSGLPILQVLDVLIERMEPGLMLDLFREVREDIKGGSSLSESFGKFPKIFPPLYIASFKAGEKTGDLVLTLGRFIAYQKRIEVLKGKIRSASFYPLLVTIAVVAVLSFLIFYVIPSFTQIYADANVELPLATRLLIGFSKGAVRSLPVTLPLLAAVALLLRGFLRTERGGLLVDRARLVLPFFGGLFADYALSSFCRTLGTTLSSGIPMVPALRMSGGTLNNRVLERSLGLVVRRVEEGTSLSAALEPSRIFPLIALRMVGIGETSGALAEMLTDVADFYEGEVEKRLDRLTTMIEPLMMLGMGLLVGGVVVAMYLPIFQMAGTVR